MSPDWPLETERLVLRPYEERDFDLLHRLQSDPEVVKWLYNDTRDESQTRTLLARKLAGTELRGGRRMAGLRRRRRRRARR